MSASRFFDGIDDFARKFGGCEVLDTDLLTASFWIKYTSTSGNESPFCTSQGTGTNTVRFGILINTTDQSIRIVHYTGSGYAAFDSAISTFPRGVWNHIVVAWDRTSPSNAPILFVNGYTVAVTGSISAFSRGTNTYTVGANANNVTNLEGHMAHVCYYNRILSQNEVREIMSHPFRITNGMLLHLPLTGNNPDIDFSGNGLHLNIITGSLGSSQGAPVAV